MKLTYNLLECLQANLEVDYSPSALSMQSIAHHSNNMNMTMSSNSVHGHDPRYGSLQHWDMACANGSAGGTSSMTYYKREDMLSNNVNYGTNLVRDVSFNSGMELESCVNMGSYTNFHYNTRPQTQALDLDTFGQNNVPSSTPLHYPNDQSDSFDIYSTFREDSYSENSDEFSNESGDQRSSFPPPFQSASVAAFNGHNHNGILSNGIIPDHNQYGGPNYFGMPHEIPVAYNGNMLASEQHILSSMPHINPNSHQMTSSTLNISVPGDSSAAHHYDFSVPHITNGCVYPTKPDGIMQSFQLPFVPSTTNYANSSPIQPYSKVETFKNETDETGKDCLNNGFQPLQHFEQNEALNKEGEQLLCPIPKDQAVGNENFGEIIKKSMVETVSA